MRYKHIGFDMDGTLIDSIPSIMKSFQQAVKEVYGHYEENEDVLKHSIGLPLAESFKFYPKEDLERLREEYIKANDFFQKDGVPFFDGVLDMLYSLKEKGHILHIVTSKRKAPVLNWIEKMGVKELFFAVVCKEDTKKNKPNGEPIEKCLELIGCKKSEFLYVGDTKHDVLCAHNAGVKVVMCGWTQMPIEDIKATSPDFWIEAPSDLIEIVK